MASIYISIDDLICNLNLIASYSACFPVTYKPRIFTSFLTGLLEQDNERIVIKKNIKMKKIILNLI